MHGINTHIFRGKRYRIKKVPRSILNPKIVRGTKRELRGIKDKETCLGLCNPPYKKNKAIKISSDLDGCEELITILHESLHACYWDTEESAIDTGSKDIGSLLWKMGYRKQ
jgi:hypothetical protein